MADTNEGTTAEATEAQSTEATPAAGTQTPDEVTTLRSRNAGLDAKVTELTKARKAAEEAAAAAAAKLAEYEAGRVGADEALRAQLAAKDAELAEVRKQAALAQVAAAYPETFSVLGEAAVALSADQLAAAEARFRGVPGEAEPPTPVGANPPRTTTRAKALEDMSAAEVEQYLRTGFNPEALFER